MENAVMLLLGIILIVMGALIAILSILLGASLGLWRNRKRAHEADQSDWRAIRLQRITDEIGRSRGRFPEYSFKRFFDKLEGQGL